METPRGRASGALRVEAGLATIDSFSKDAFGLGSGNNHEAMSKIKERESKNRRKLRGRRERDHRPPPGAYFILEWT